MPRPPRSKISMSEASVAADAYIASHRAEAVALGEGLAQSTEEPEAFVSVLVAGLAALSDAQYAATIRRVSPDSRTDLAVRGPLVSAIQAPLRRALRESSSASALMLAQRLAQAEQREVRAFTMPCLERSLGADPERTWQLLRRLGRGAEDWIEVDGMAALWARGVLAESFRWAELEQLVYSGRTMERRIVGATLACMPHAIPAARRASLVGDVSERAYRLVRTLIGDAAPMVQKSLSWAIREWAHFDQAGTDALLRDETAIAVEQADGQRAWVIRDALSNQPAEAEADLRARLSNLRRKPGATSTSIAAAEAATFAGGIGNTDRAIARQGDRYTRSYA